MAEEEYDPLRRKFKYKSIWYGEEERHILPSVLTIELPQEDYEVTYHGAEVVRNE